jgi:hypothetical protein
MRRRERERGRERLSWISRGGRERLRDGKGEKRE